MGYQTEFAGEITIEPPLNQDEIEFLTAFCETRRMNRSGGPLFVKGEGVSGQGNGPDTIHDYNNPPVGQPGLWCQWVPTDDGTALEWDGGEKFYNSLEWMEYIVNRLLSPAARAYVDAHLDEDERLKSFTCNHVLNGTVDADGEDPDDLWQIIVEDNVVKAAEGKIVYDGPAEPDFDTVEAVGLDGTGRTGGPYTWEDVARAALAKRESQHTFHGWTFEITSVAVDVKGPLGYVLTKVSLEEAVNYVLVNGRPDGKAV